MSKTFIYMIHSHKHLDSSLSFSYFTLFPFSLSLPFFPPFFLRDYQKRIAEIYTPQKSVIMIIDSIYINVCISSSTYLYCPGGVIYYLLLLFASKYYINRLAYILTKFSKTSTNSFRVLEEFICTFIYTALLQDFCLAANRIEHICLTSLLFNDFVVKSFVQSSKQR